MKRKYILFSIKHIILFKAYTNNVYIIVVNNNNKLLVKHLAFFNTTSDCDIFDSLICKQFLKMEDLT